MYHTLRVVIEAHMCGYLQFVHAVEDFNERRAYVAVLVLFQGL